MTTNNYPTPGTRRMNTADLTVGQTLVQTHSYGYGSHYSFTDWTVAKILKTRLVLSRDILNEEGEVIRTIEFRLVVTYSKRWPYSNGEVTTHLEGESNNYGRGVTLFTADDPALQGLRDMNEFQKIVRTANEAAEKATSKLMSVKDAQEAIDALQAFITASTEA